MGRGEADGGGVGVGRLTGKKSKAEDPSRWRAASRYQPACSLQKKCSTHNSNDRVMTGLAGTNADAYRTPAEILAPLMYKWNIR
ncbi:uncharacterized protein PpBr36_10002 [Pyricularia pennisetigena]|uniref:uncharacterized protein n=1 Tax=Pyricularia pennisetigena TaxID=1578925 RepID=UPI0011527B9F|nr:uncharacterized protein PpBr36_10002 [Pyricularia pennisetigena]TLS22222.1 hypothetical protein PpBr36_10002 [Pyricularia pennisetigena]